MRSSAQKRLTAVGRVAPRPLMASSRSAMRPSKSRAALARGQDHANAAVTPMAGPSDHERADGRPPPARSCRDAPFPARAQRRSRSRRRSPASGSARSSDDSLRRRALRPTGARPRTRKNLSRAAPPRTSSTDDGGTPRAAASSAATARWPAHPRGGHARGASRPPAHHLLRGPGGRGRGASVPLACWEERSSFLFGAGGGSAPGEASSGGNRAKVLLHHALVHLDGGPDPSASWRRCA